jgi:hypothetical protein
VQVLDELELTQRALGENSLGKVARADLFNRNVGIGCELYGGPDGAVGAVADFLAEFVLFEDVCCHGLYDGLLARHGLYTLTVPFREKRVGNFLA